MTGAPVVGGVDVGGGGIRFRVQAGQRRAEHHLSAALPNRRGAVDVEALVAAVANGLHLSVSQVGERALASLAVGVSGLPGRLDHPEEFAAKLDSVIHSTITVIAGDAVTAHAGALGLRPGAVVSAGTGVIALGTDYADTWNRADGWGYILGDEGGGAWIGAAGLRAALRAHDRRPGGSAILLERMNVTFGPADAVVHQIYDRHMPAHVLASFAPAVAEAALAGDPAATTIWAEAGIHLAHAAISVVGQLAPVISWTGGLFNAGLLLLTPFLAEVRRVRPDITPLAPNGSSLDGAIRIATAAMAADTSIDTRDPYLYLYSRIPMELGTPSTSIPTQGQRDPQEEPNAASPLGRDTPSPA